MNCWREEGGKQRRLGTKGGWTARWFREGWLALAAEFSRDRLTDVIECSTARLERSPSFCDRPVEPTRRSALCNPTIGRA